MALMEQCKKCRWYDKEYDKLHRREITKEMHFCPMHMLGVPMGIVNDQKKCEYFWKKEHRFPFFRSR